MASASCNIEKGQGLRLAWKPVIDFTEYGVCVSLPQEFNLVNSSDGRSGPAATADLDTALYLNDDAQSTILRAAFDAALCHISAAGLDYIGKNALARWELQAAIEASARRTYESSVRAGGPKPSRPDPIMAMYLPPKKTSKLRIELTPRPITGAENLGPLSQIHRAMPSHALFPSSMSIEFGWNRRLSKVRYTMPSLVVAETGAGPLTGEINGKIDNSLLEQMARSSVTLLHRLYQFMGAEARSMTMENWLSTNCEIASAVLGHRIDHLLGQANATEIAILEPDTCTSSLSTQRATWPLSKDDWNGPVFEIVAGPTKKAVEESVTIVGGSSLR